MWVSKILVHVGDAYLMSRKKAPGRPKDGGLEHLGGHGESGETPLEAAIREAREEEASGGLAGVLEAQRPAPRELRVGRDGEPHYLFDVQVDRELADAFEADPAESHGLELVDGANLDDPARRATFARRLTPKTVAIYRALDRERRVG